MPDCPAFVASVLQTVFRELVDGSPDPLDRTYVLNQGDPGLLAALDRLTATEASRSNEGASIAAHVDHLQYGLSILNLWAQGRLPQRADIDFTTSWRRESVSSEEWDALRRALRREADAWASVLGEPRSVSDVEAGWLLGSLAHLAYHLGAIRQISRTTRGPTAEDEASNAGGR